MFHSSNFSQRRPKIKLTSFGSNYVRVLNPFMPMWWSLAMPGAGHVMIGKIAKGFLLFIWEIVINNQAHLNVAIFYTLTGKFQLAKDSLDQRWFFVYIGVYIFNAWDSYRLATDVSLFSMLAVREKSPIKAFSLDLFEINYLQKINVWIPVFWSIITPGLGHLVVRNVVHGVYLMLWYIITLYQSRLLEGVYYTIIGDFHHAIYMMNLQWTLFLPSLYCFSVCDAYYRTIEINELFKMEQARFLENKYRKTNRGFLNELG